MRWPFGRKTETAAVGGPPFVFDVSEYAKPASVEIVQSGICKHRGYLHLVHPEMHDRGIKLVSIPADFAERFERVRIEWNQIQYELSKYPQSLRPRQRKVSAESDNG